MKKYVLFISIFTSVLFLTPNQSIAQRMGRSRYLKNVNEARTKAISGTLFPIALGVGTATFIENKTIETTASILATYGLVFGPSFGNFYARDYLRGMLGVAARTAGGYLMLDATREIAGDDVADALGWDNKSVSLTDTRVLIGSGIIIGSAIYNIISSKASVRRFNANMGYSVQVIPTVREGKVLPMVAASINF